MALSLTGRRSGMARARARVEVGVRVGVGVTAWLALALIPMIVGAPVSVLGAYP